ncbi:hypothetical protein SLE2022_406000 [Rubroshorea leprosula]
MTAGHRCASLRCGGAMDLATRYGPWAIVTGASEGTGAAFAHAVAAAADRADPRGAARGAAPLARRRDRGGARRSSAWSPPSIWPRPMPAGASSRRWAIARWGCFVANAGADPNGRRFLDADIEAWTTLVETQRRNDDALLPPFRACDARAAARRAAAGELGCLLWGARFMAAYAASKAFALCFAEALWDELRDDGVDVLTYVMGMTDTPALRALLADKGLPFPADAAAIRPRSRRARSRCCRMALCRTGAPTRRIAASRPPRRRNGASACWRSGAPARACSGRERGGQAARRRGPAGDRGRAAPLLPRGRSARRRARPRRVPRGCDRSDYGHLYAGPARPVIDLICAAHRGLACHSHQIANILIDLDGDRAGSEAYVTATLRMENAGVARQMTVWSRYVDRWSRRDGRWAIDARVAVTDFDEIRDVVPMRDHAVGRRDGDDPSCAVLGWGR